MSCLAGLSTSLSSFNAARCHPFISTVYRNPVYHQIAFASIMLVSIYRTNYLIGLLQPSKGIDQCVKSTIVKLYWAGTATFLLGFLIWNLDNVFCQNLTTWKVAIGWPFAFLLEG
jgi:dihydroceramidase